MYIKLLPVFEASSKRNYVELSCRMVETLYATIDPKILHLVRLPIRHFRRFARQQRKRRIDDDIYQEQKKHSDNGTENEETMNEMAKLKRRIDS